METLNDRFLRKTTEVEPPPHIATPCRIWTGATVTNRTGMVRGRVWHNGKMVLAHRLACAVKEGKTIEELEGLVVLHECDRPLCVCHVRSGTQQENCQDMIGKGRAPWQQKGVRV